jgi:hypothetical protein
MVRGEDLERLDQRFGKHGEWALDRRRLQF